MHARMLGGLALCLAFVIVSSGMPSQAQVNTAAGEGIHASSPVERRSPCLRPLALPRQATRSWEVAPGVRAQTWQWRDRGAVGGQVRVSAVRMSGGEGVVRPTARIPQMTDPASAARHRGVLAVLNGDFFDTLPRGDALPQGALIVDTKPVFMPAGWSQVVVWNAKGRLRTTHVALDASLRADGKSWKVSAVNDPFVGGQRLAVVTSQWQRPHIPDGIAAIVVKDGAVVAVHRVTRDVRVPSSGYAIVSATSRALPSLRPGTRVTLNLDVKTSDYQDIVHAAGHGGIALKDGDAQPICSAYERIPRPRSMLAWSDDGQVWFLAASSGLPDRSEGMRQGGMTKEELARVARQLGADTGVILDGGGSTALYTRRGERVERLDMPEGSWVRPIPVLWQMVRTS